MPDDKKPKQNFNISRRQLDVLVEKAGEEAVKAALIQNGSAPTEFPSEFSVSRPQLEALVQRAGGEAVKAALIQNGSAPTDFQPPTVKK